MNCLAKGTLCDTNKSFDQSQHIITDSCKLQKGFKCQRELVFFILAAPHCCFIPLPLEWRIWNKCIKKKKRKKYFSCFTVFSALLELNYVGTVIRSLSARRWQISMVQFERCVVKYCSFALDLQTLCGTLCANHRSPQSCVDSSLFSPVVSAAACSWIQLLAAPHTP